jgi:predicted aminopeptidase
MKPTTIPINLPVLKRSFVKASRFYCLLTLLLLSSSGCYYLKQGSYALKYQCRAQPNKKLLARPTTPKDIAEFLATVEEIRAFAYDSLGLKRNNNYSRYIKVDKSYLIDNVYAARPDTFAQYYWHYPFLGAMPYKGFFERADALKEQAALQKKGYDVLVGEVDGYSSLGIVSDPVYSFMKKYGPYSLSNLIFHELTHATVYRKNRTQFNEEAATFIGTEGALRYIAFKFGVDSDKYRRVILSLGDNEAYRKSMNRLYAKLDSVYRTEPSREKRIAAKNEIIGGFKRSFMIRYDSLFKTKNYLDIPQSTINNASIMIHMTYSRDLDLYNRLFEKCGKNLKTTIAALVRISKIKGDPKQNLTQWLADGNNK